MGAAVFTLCCLTWGQTMMEIMKNMMPNSAAGHCWPMPPLETPGYLQASLGQSVWGHCSFLLGPGAHKVLYVSSKSLSPQSYVSSGGFTVGLTATSSKRVYAIPRSTAPRAPAPADPYLHRRHSIIVLALSLRGLWVLMCTRFVRTLQVSLAGVGFDSKPNFAPFTILLGLLLYPWIWDIFFSWDPTLFCR